MTSEPSKGTLMKSRMKWFCTTGRSRATDHLRGGRGAESLVATACQHWSEVLDYRVPSPRIRNHHSFLHRPCVISPDEPLDTSIAVMLTHRVIIVDWLAFGEQGVLRGLHGQVLTLHKEEH